ncbi:MAG: SMC-Scp complex subunit ScpB [Clostridia bacterium]|nr:SMC-Scp complex subunit ScpB [Clostridia bacterium]
MNKEQKISALLSVLFSSGEPMSIDRLSTVFEEKPEKIEETAKLLQERLKEQKMGIMLLRLQNSYQLASDEQYAEYIKRAFDIKRRTPLSPAALEVLSVVAYNQPVTKSFVEQVRGVDCSGVMTTLVEKGLIEERGRLELPGRPLLYGTTKNFLRCFSISDLSELPKLPEDKPQINDVGEQLAMDEIDVKVEEE